MCGRDRESAPVFSLAASQRPCQWARFLTGAVWLLASAVSQAQVPASTTTQAPPDWVTVAPRKEIRPSFVFEPRGGPGCRGALIISANDRPGLQGCWAKRFRVTGGEWFQFRVLRKTSNVDSARRQAHVEVHWQDELGQPVVRPETPDKKRFGMDTFPNPVPKYAIEARPEFPRDGQTDQHGWTEVAGVYCAPPTATWGRVELHLRWATEAVVQWSEASLTPTAAPNRKARLASIYLEGPRAATALDACRLYAPYIEEASSKGADLVCLTETLTSHFTGLSHLQVAETIPGSSTEYLGGLSKKYNLYIVAGLVERDGTLLYNTAALIGPGGDLVGKYRKVCLTSEEGNKKGIFPGDALPVFETRFGKVGLMICWDLQFPEIARTLSNKGAEVIVMPIAGGNPVLASARAIENQIYLVTCTRPGRKNWLQSGIFDYDGKMLAIAEKSRPLAVAEVDLAGPNYWAHLGDLKSKIPRQRPPDRTGE